MLISLIVPCYNEEESLPFLYEALCDVRKAETSPEEVKGDLRKARIDARTSKTRATRLDVSLKNAKSRIAALEAGVRDLAAEMGFKLVKSTRPRRKKA